VTLNLQPDAPAGHGGTPASPRPRRWGVTGKLDPLCAHVAPQLGVQPKTVEHYLRGRNAVNLTAAAIVRAFVALGDHVRLQRFLAPIRDAERGVTPLLTDALERETAERAHQAVEAELLYAQAPTLPHAKLLLRSLDQALAELSLTRAALAGAHGL